MFNGNFGGFAAPSRVGVRPDARLAQAFLTQAFFWMFLGLLLTTGIGVVVSSLPTSQVDSLFFPAVIAQFVLGFALMLGIRRMSATLGLLLFFVYAALTGATLGLLLQTYALGSVLAAGSSAAGVFAGAAFYGAVTRRDLSKMGAYLFMGLVGLIVAIVINMFVGWSTLSFAISIAGVVIFTALTAYDVQLIQSGGLAAWLGSMEKAAVFGAFKLYLDFINLFLFMLRLFGGNGRR